MKKRLFALTMALLMIVSIAACAGEETPPVAETPTATPVPSQTTDPGDGNTDSDGDVDTPSFPIFDYDITDVLPPVDELRNLGGVELIIGDWWTPERQFFNPKNLREEQTLELREYLEEHCGFTISNLRLASWSDYLEIFTTSIMAGEPEADMFIMSAEWALALMGQGLLYPLNTLDSIDVNDDKWNQAIMEPYIDDDGNVYALSANKYVEPRNFLFYNKRLFREAGIDPEEPYNLQASGDWTWDVFWDYCEKLTRDTNGDGIPDTYAFTGFWGPTQAAFINSNDARHVGVNPDGTLYNAMTEPNFIEAMEFVYKFYDAGHWTNGPEGAEWDWFTTGFADGHAAMCIPIGAYQSEEFLDMEDEWGLLFPPKGPRADDYNTIHEENVLVLPFNISKEKAEEVMYAYNLWTTTLPYDVANPDYWKDGAWGYQRYKDTRAVDETMAMFYEGRMEFNSKKMIDPGGNFWGETFDWGSIQNAHESSVIERIEMAKPVIDARIAEVNAQSGR